MKESIERSYRIETEKGGLIIKQALFGNLDSQDQIYYAIYTKN